jgi:hypothetical protein
VRTLLTSLHGGTYLPVWQPVKSNLWKRLVELFKRIFHIPPKPVPQISSVREFSPLALVPAYKNENVRHLTVQERLSYRVECAAGKFLRQGRPYNTTLQKQPIEPQSDAFVISLEGQFLGGAIVPGKFHHSSFLAGGDVLFAGEWETDAAGKIQKISNRSGHYRPQLVHLLKA